MRALWSDRQKRTHNVSQNLKRIRCFSDAWLPQQSLAVVKIYFSVQILGGERLLEKCR